MNELYNETVERNGKTYHYDPDMDIYYSRYEPNGHWDKYNWIYVIVVLCAVAYYVEFIY